MNGDAEGKRYRAASEALDERPSAATRAAILAAAGRQVEAQPRAAESPLAQPRRSPALRWPWAAAATVLLSTLAVMMATQTEREMPTFTPPASAPAERNAAAPETEGRAPTVAVPAEPARAGAAPPVRAEATAPALENKQRGEQRAAQDRLAERSERDAPQKQPAAATPATTPAPEAASAPPIAAGEERLRAKQEAAERRANEAVAPPPAPAASGALLKRSAPAAKPDAMTSSTAERQHDERADAANAPPAALPKQTAPAAGALGAAAGDPARESELSAEQWLQKIIALRAAGRDDEADAELRRFRERHPQVQVPRTALPASGTR